MREDKINTDEKNTKLAFATTAAISAIAASGAAVNYPNTPEGLSQKEIENFLPKADTALKDANFITSHNAFTDYDFLGNQHNSTSWLLDNTPTRGFQLDIIKGDDGKYYIEHALHGTTNPPELEESLQEINKWIENNPDQVLMFDINVMDPSLRQDPNMEKIFEDVFGDKINGVYMDNPTIGDLTDSGCNIVIRQNDFYGSDWNNCEFVSFDHVYAHNDTAGYFVTRGFPFIDDEAFRYSDIDEHFISADKLNELSNTQNGSDFNLDFINKNTFKNAKGFESEPTIGPFRNDSPIFNDSAIAAASGGITFSLVGPAALLAIETRNILNKIDFYSKNPNQLNKATEKQLVQQVIKTGLRQTAISSNALVTAGITYPALLEPFGISALATLGAGAAGTLVSAYKTSKSLKEIEKRNGMEYKFWPENEPPNLSAENNNENSIIKSDKNFDSSSDKLQKITDLISTLSMLMRFTSTTKYVLPTIAPAAAGAGLALLATNCAIDQITHTRMINQFISNPEKAVDYYKNQSISNKKWLFWGNSKITLYLDKKNKTDKDVLKDIFSDPNSIKNGTSLFVELISNKEDFLYKELDFFIKSLSNKEVKELSEITELSKIISIKKHSDPKKVNQIDHVDANKIIKNLKKLTLKWNELYASNTFDKLNKEKTDEFKQYDKAFNEVWNFINNTYMAKNNSTQTFQQNFSSRLIKKDEYLNNSLSAIEKKFELDALLEYAKRSHLIPEGLRLSKKNYNVPKWIIASIESYSKLTESEQKNINIREILIEKVKQHYEVSENSPQNPNIHNPLKRINNFEQRKQKYLKLVNHIIEDAIIWKVKRIMRNDIRKHGYANTSQLAVGVASIGVVAPAVSGCFVAASVGTLTLGSLLTEGISKYKTQKWENNYYNLQDVQVSYKRLKYLANSSNLDKTIDSMTNDTLNEYLKDTGVLSKFVSTLKRVDCTKEINGNEIAEFVGGLGNQTVFKDIRNKMEKKLTNKSEVKLNTVKKEKELKRI